MVSYTLESMENSTVATLTDENTRQWNERLIDGIFAQEEVKIIKKIPLAQIASKNVLIWPHSHDGRYTYKSGYGFLKEEA